MVPMGAIIGHIVIPRWWRARASVVARFTANRTPPALRLRKIRCIPRRLLATVYHALGIDPHTIVNNHLNQPRELVQAEPVTGLFI